MGICCFRELGQETKMEEEIYAAVSKSLEIGDASRNLCKS